MDEDTRKFIACEAANVTAKMLSTGICSSPEGYDDGFKTLFDTVAAKMLSVLDGSLAVMVSAPKKAAA